MDFPLVTKKLVGRGQRFCASEATFLYKNLQLKMADASQLRMKPQNHENRFGQVFTDHMLKISYSKTKGGWEYPRIIPLENIVLHPGAKVLHNAIELFEGMQAFRGVDDKVRIFRPEFNMRRMNISAENAELPTFKGKELVKCLKKLIQIEKDWIPATKANALYIRPTLIGVDGTLGLEKSNYALLFVFVCPIVRGFFKNGVKLLADPAYVRTCPGGVGHVKMGAKYVPTIKIQQEVLRRGLQQILWLYGPDHQITEIGSMNVMVVYKDKAGFKVVATPPLEGLVLEGVARSSILELVNEWKDYKVEERVITMKEIIELNKNSCLLEMFGCGIACAVSPVNEIEYLGQRLVIPTTKHPEPLYERIRIKINDILYGHIKHPWAQGIDDIV